jgi:hypothetical protein
MKKLGGVALLILSLFMALGLVRSGVDLGAPATIAAALITIILPAAGGIALLGSPFGHRARLAQRREALRQQTYESEILRLAAQRQGRLTAVELVTEFAITPEKANELLESLVSRDLADIQVTDSGVVVYSFHDVRHLGDKERAKGILDA